MAERIINILWEGEPGQSCGYNEVLRKLDATEDESLFNASHATITVADASPLACATGDSLLQFSEEQGIVPTWVGMQGQ
ncbi:hypothetical protein H6G36_25620 [Anabaena minutissima FACHB-250]|nr:hypothetical protein [Anabaena minutissima FACHB-250]